MSDIFGRAVVVREDGRRWWAKAARVRGAGTRRYALGGGGRCTDSPGGGCPTCGRRGLRVCWGIFTGVVGDSDRIAEARGGGGLLPWIVVSCGAEEVLGLSVQR